MNLTYCAVEEAFDNPLRQQMQRMDRENNINNYRASLARNIEENQRKYGINPPHTTNNTTQKIEGYINEKQYPSVDLPFFTAQGDFENAQDPSTKGTTISELRRRENEKI